MWSHRQGAQLLPVYGLCVECGELATQIVMWSAIYRSRPTDEQRTKRFLLCACGAYVGCHPDTENPMGRPAKKATHAARSKAHAAFDRLWKAKAARDGCSHREARNLAYEWLAGALGIPRAACHVGLMDRDTAKRVVEVCAPYHGARKRAADQPQEGI
jgi:hypothetical protein